MTTLVKNKNKQHCLCFVVVVAIDDDGMDRVGGSSLKRNNCAKSFVYFAESKSESEEIGSEGKIKDIIAPMIARREPVVPPRGYRAY